MRFVFLILEYVPHQTSLFNEILKDSTSIILSYTVNEKFKFDPIDKDRFETKLMTKSSSDEMYNQIIEFKPDLICTGGWAYKKYNKLCRKIKKKSTIPIVAMTDTQWRGTIKQHINCMLSPITIRKYFTNIWVAGIYQFEYARKLGFKKNQIIYNSLSCDVELFSQVNIENKKNNYPKNFLYIGRFVTAKGLQFLVDAWKQIKNKKGWTLTLIGDGSLKEKISETDQLFIHDYMNHSDLINKMNSSGCFILPSIFEPWALVIQEAASAGLPLITTNACGASPHFVINGYNGFIVEPGNSASLRQSIEKIINMPDQQLLQYSYNSRKISQCITLELGVANMMSLLDKKNQS